MHVLVQPRITVLFTSIYTIAVFHLQSFNLRQKLTKSWQAGPLNFNNLANKIQLANSVAFSKTLGDTVLSTEPITGGSYYAVVAVWICLSGVQV